MDDLAQCQVRSCSFLRRRADEMERIAIREQFQRLLRRNEMAFERESDRFNVGLPEPSAQDGTAQFL
jgi:hypothetical protein